MKTAIINVLAALAERIKPCKHEWFGEEYKETNEITGYCIGVRKIYFCKKCGKIVKTSITE